VNQCSKCRKIKELTDFTKASWCTNGRRGVCSACNRLSTRIYIQSRPDWKESRRAYEKANYEKILKDRRENKKRRYNTDLNFKILCVLRSRLRAAILGRRGALRELGCSIDELKLHLSAQFKSGMSWDNYGQWHIDHVIPVSKFDLTDDAQITKCFNFKNLQPLWAEENLKKGAHVRPQQQD
jgi:hypothetical protein